MQNPPNVGEYNQNSPCQTLKIKASDEPETSWLQGPALQKNLNSRLAMDKSGQAKQRDWGQQIHCTTRNYGSRHEKVFFYAVLSRYIRLLGTSFNDRKRK